MNVDIKIDILEIIANNIADNFSSLYVVYMKDIDVIQLYNHKYRFRYLLLRDGHIICRPHLDDTIIKFDVFDPLLFTNINEYIINEIQTS